MKAKKTKKRQSLLIKSISKLELTPKDILIIHTKKSVPEEVQQRTTDSIGQHLGFRAAVMFLADDTDVKVLKVGKA